MPLKADDAGRSATLIARPDRAHALVAMRCYVRGGSIAEWPQGGSGVAHLLEHLAATRAARALRARQLGAVLQASTARDHTCFAWKALPDDGPDSLRTVLDAISAMDAIAGAEELDAQRRVILEELRPHEANPLRAFRQQFLEHLLLVHPARYPVSGYSDRLRRVNREEVAAYHRRVYHAANVLIIAVGDCDPDALVEVIDESPLARGARVPWTLPADTESQAHTRSFAVQTQGATHEYTEVGFVIPGSPSPDADAMDMLSAAFNGDPRRGRLFAESDADVDVVSRCITTALDVGCFSILARHTIGAGVAVEATLRAWLERVSRGDARLRLSAGESALHERTLDEQAALLGLRTLRQQDPLASRTTTAEQIAEAVTRHGAPRRLLAGRLRCSA